MPAEILPTILLNEEAGPVRTIPVFGVGRGGTSMVAGCLRILGVCMGEKPHALRHEWSPLTMQKTVVDRAASFATITRMNGQHSLWGWKSLPDVFCFEQVASMLRQPGIIIVTRDLLEVAFSSERRQGVPKELALTESAEIYRHIFSRLRFWPWPIMILSHARAQQNPAGLIGALARFAGLPVTAAAQAEAMAFLDPARQGYRQTGRPEDAEDAKLLEEDARLYAKCQAAEMNAIGALDRLVHAANISRDAVVAARLLQEQAGHPAQAAAVQCFWSELRARPQWEFTGEGFAWPAESAANCVDVVLLCETAHAAVVREQERFQRERLQGTKGYTDLARGQRLLHDVLRLRLALQAALDRVQFAGTSPV